MCTPQAGSAQGFFATGTVVQGSAAITTAPDLTHVVAHTRQVVINWTVGDDAPLPDGDPYNFLPIDSMARFTGDGEASSGYTVLNRVLTARRAAFNGTLKSFVGDDPGGEIWFYSPSGIYVGPHAIFSVGSLVLTANEIETAGGLYGIQGEIRFRGVPSSKAGIHIARGAEISAHGSSAYVALVAPSILQRGTISANGSVALVAAEQADITVNAGLLDVVVFEGTTHRNGIVHDGTTGGPSPTRSQTLSFIAIPKNDAMTMLLSGRIGYQAATQASADGGVVVLTAGDGRSQVPASITIKNARFSSPVSALASDSIEVAPSAGGVAVFDADSTLAAANSVRLLASGGSRIDAVGFLSVSATTGASGGRIVVSADSAPSEPIPGEISVASLVVGASGIAESGDGNGGDVSIGANGGKISSRRLTIDTSGRGAAGGFGTGGAILLSVADGGLITAPELDAQAAGFGGAAELLGGDARGGTITVRDEGGELDLALVNLDASATAGEGALGSGGASGGRVTIDILSQTQVWDELALDTSARAPLSANPPSELVGGAIAISTAPAGTLTLGGNLVARADGTSAPSGPAFRLLNSGSPVLINGSADISAAGDVELGSSGASSLHVGGELTIDTPASARAAGLVTAGGGTSIAASSGIAFTRLQSGQATLLRAPSGSVTILTDLRSQGSATVIGESVDIVSDGPLAFSGLSATAGNLSLRSAGDLDVIGADANGAIDLRSTTDLRTGTLRGEDISLEAGRNLHAQGPITAESALRIGAGDLVSISGAAVGTEIVVRSADIELGADAVLGRRGSTSSIDLINSRPAGPTLLGGQRSSASAYGLDGDEVGRLFADQAIGVVVSGFDQLGATAADFVIEDVVLRFGPDGNIGEGGALRLQTPGDVTVRGAALVETARESDTVAVAAANIGMAPGGSLALLGSGGIGQGRLSLTADRVVAADGEAAAAIEAGAAPTAISGLLDRPASDVSAPEYLRAGRLEVGVLGGFFVQNRGASSSLADRRGLSATDLAISTRSSSAVIIINGTTVGADGRTLAGLETIEDVVINGLPATRGRDLGVFSSINGCIVGQTCGGGIDVRRPRSSIAAELDLSDKLGGNSRLGSIETHSERGSISLLDRNDATVVEGVIVEGMLNRDFEILPYLLFFKRPDPISKRPLLDTPATGVGNDDLWHLDCGLGTAETCGPPDTRAVPGPP